MIRPTSSRDALRIRFESLTSRVNVRFAGSLCEFIAPGWRGISREPLFHAAPSHLGRNRGSARRAAVVSCSDLLSDDRGTVQYPDQVCGIPHRPQRTLAVGRSWRGTQRDFLDTGANEGHHDWRGGNSFRFAVPAAGFDGGSNEVYRGFDLNFCCVCCRALQSAAISSRITSRSTRRPTGPSIRGRPPRTSPQLFLRLQHRRHPGRSVWAGTRGLKLQANQSSGVFGGVSVSPNGQSFFGDYVLQFDWWENFNGPAPVGGSGSTQLGTFGVGTSGTSPQWPGGTQDSIWFGGTGDGNSSSDWRAYSPAPAGVTRYADSAPGYLSRGRHPSGQLEC